MGIWRKSVIEKIVKSDDSGLSMLGANGQCDSLHSLNELT